MPLPSWSRSSAFSRSPQFTSTISRQHRSSTRVDALPLPRVLTGDLSSVSLFSLTVTRGGTQGKTHLSSVVQVCVSPNTQTEMAWIRCHSFNNSKRVSATETSPGVKDTPSSGGSRLQESVLFNKDGRGSGRVGRRTISNSRSCGA